MNHILGLCGENHPSILTFILGHNEVNESINFLKHKFHVLRCKSKSKN